MTLLEKQFRFTHMVAQLILHAEQLGYSVTLGEAWRLPHATHGHPQSTHKHRLAIDLNLFRGGVWLTSGAEHGPLHDYWDSIGGAPRIDGDMNHYSLAHNGVR
jgi:hypothetical protein